MKDELQDIEQFAEGDVIGLMKKMCVLYFQLQTIVIDVVTKQLLWK